MAQKGSRTVTREIACPCPVMNSAMTLTLGAPTSVAWCLALKCILTSGRLQNRADGGVVDSTSEAASVHQPGGSSCQSTAHTAVSGAECGYVSALCTLTQ